MNFFEAQERARRSSRFLVLWFGMAVMGVILVIYLVAVTLNHFNKSNSKGIYLATDVSQLRWWDQDIFIAVTILVGGLISIGSWVKLSKLSAGGGVVASNLGGREIEPGTRDLRERRLLNVVEEMAIASGVPMPGVWVMDDEKGINAFAAGTDPANAVIGVTRGTLERLTRSELQGVIAHEFSHILNGDMKLNIRLMGWIFGLVMLATLGNMMMESLRFIRVSRDSKGGSGGLVLALFIGGMAVWIIGSIGVLFSRMLQASISRQREYLADASAVQFTRDPSGITGALKKIGGFVHRGTITSPKAAEVRHMFFAGSTWSNLMATHPPLDKRIKAIDSRWDGKLDKAEIVRLDESEFSGEMGFANGELADLISSEYMERIGASEAIQPDLGHALAAKLGADDSKASSTLDAKCMLLGMLVTSNMEESIHAVLHGAGFEEDAIHCVFEWNKKMESHSCLMKLTMVDMSIAWLRRMQKDEAIRFLAATQAMIDMDGQVELFEFVIQKVIERHIEVSLGLSPVPAMRYRKLVDLHYHVCRLLSAFSFLSGDENSLAAATEEYRQHTGLELERTESCVANVALALKEMDAASPLVKQQILRLCSLVVNHDRKADDMEFVLLRATAEAMGAPMPPLVKMVA